MSKVLDGKIIKGIGGFYYVETDEGIVECRARGRFRHDGITPLVGDMVSVEEAYVIDILPRKNSLVRPKVANIDKAVIVFAVKDPKINYEILDRFLILSAEAGVKAVICINKIDLDKTGVSDEVREIYANCGYNILETSTKNGVGIDKATDELKGCTSVLAGPSGVGKSSIINLLVPNSNLKTDSISKKISRGKHTTREAVLLSMGNGGYVADTPGFTSLSLEHIPSKDLSGYFREFAPFEDECRYSSCSHINERTEDCGVKPQVGKTIHIKRYGRYERIYKELRITEEEQYD